MTRFLVMPRRRRTNNRLQGWIVVNQKVNLPGIDPACLHITVVNKLLSLHPSRAPDEPILKSNVWNEGRVSSVPSLRTGCESGVRFACRRSETTWLHA